jgi:hypothetical protein
MEPISVVISIYLGLGLLGVYSVWSDCYHISNDNAMHDAIMDRFDRVDNRMRLRLD